MALNVGDRCLVSSKRGVVMFVGETKFAPGRWLGIALDTAEGKNNGSVQDVRYFTCEPLHGLFVKQGMAKKDSSAAAASNAGEVGTKRDELLKRMESKQQLQQMSTPLSALNAASPARSTTPTQIAPPTGLSPNPAAPSPAPGLSGPAAE